MPIMSAMDKNDSRASARFLAVTTKRCVDVQLTPFEHRTELRGMFRFLNAYRSHGFVGHDYTPRNIRGAEALSLRPTPDRHVGDLRLALEESLKEAFGENEAPEVAIERIDAVIKAIATTEETPADREETSLFLAALIGRLKAW